MLGSKPGFEGGAEETSCQRVLKVTGKDSAVDFAWIGKWRTPENEAANSFPITVVALHAEEVSNSISLERRHMTRVTITIIINPVY